MKRIARSVYRRLIAAAVRAWAAREAPGRGAVYDPRRVRRVLVLRMGLLGDGVQTVPALRILRDGFPSAQIDLLAMPIQMSIFEPLPFVDRVIPWRAGDLLELRDATRLAAWQAAWQTIRELRQARYDVAVSCYGKLGSAIALLSGAVQRFGYAGEAYPGALTFRLPGERYDRLWHDAEYSAAVARLAVDPSASLEFSRDDVHPVTLVVPAEGRKAASALLPSGTTLALVHPGATNGEAKRWPVQHWVALCRRLIADGLTVVMVGGPEHRSLARGLQREIGGRGLIDLVGRTTIPALMGVIERAHVFVSGDSGPLHVAVGLGRPVVAIHGPTDPHLSGPFDLSRATVLRHKLPCMPCYRLDRVADCPLGHTLCQWLVTPERVYQAVVERLEAATSPVVAS